MNTKIASQCHQHVLKWVCVMAGLISLHGNAENTPQSNEDLRAALISAPWTWVRSAKNGVVYRNSLHFKSDGTFSSKGGWGGKWEIEDISKVKITVLNGLPQEVIGKGTILTFSKGYESYTAEAFYGVPDPVTGEKLGRKARSTPEQGPAASGANTATTDKPESAVPVKPAVDPAKIDALKSRISGTQWTWRATRTSFNGEITFNDDSVSFSWGGSATWTASDDGQVTLATTDGKQISLRFDALYATYTAAETNGTIARGSRVQTPTTANAALLPPHPSKVPAVQIAEASLSAPVVRTITLRPGWDSLHKGGEVTIRDLALSLRGVGTANANPFSSEAIRIYEGITFLMPLKEAVHSLGLSQKPPTRKKVACPGFPKDTLECVLYDGLFESRFNRICLVVDAADQVVSVQLVEETPKTVDPRGEELSNTYNFVETRLKSLGALRVHSNTWIQNPRTSEWVMALTPGLMKSPPQLVRVDSWVKNGAKPLEYVQWYAPMPFVDLLQYCIQRNTTGK